MHNEVSQSLAIKELADRVLCEKHLLPFVVKSNRNYRVGYVHEEICYTLEDFLQDVIDEKSPRAMIFMPPRTGKSEIVSRCFPAWAIGKYPWLEIIACSYSTTLSNEFSRKVRSLIKEEDYKLIFPETELDPDDQSVASWKTTEKGVYVSAGVGTGITGKGGNIIIIDDPVKNREEANSPTTREAVWGWYTSTLYTRLMPGGGVIVVATRWHHDDLMGRLVEDMCKGGEYTEKWKIISYPAIATQDDHFRKKGEALHPERYNIHALNRIRRSIGDDDFEALYQQNPTKKSGAIFKQDMFVFYEFSELPKKEDLNFYCAWDLAVSTKQTNDYSVGITVAVDLDDNLWIVDLFRFKVETSELIEHMIDIWEIYRHEIIGLEAGVIKHAIAPFLNKRISERRAFSMNVEPLPSGNVDKITRARSIQGRMRQGKVLFPKNALYTQDLINELLQFPQGKHDDQVDALAYIGLMLDEMQPKREEREISSAEKWRRHLRNQKSSGYLTA